MAEPTVADMLMPLDRYASKSRAHSLAAIGLLLAFIALLGLCELLALPRKIFLRLRDIGRNLSDLVQAAVSSRRIMKKYSR